MRPLLLVVLAAAAAAGAAPATAAPAPERAAVAGYRLALGPHAGACRLRFRAAGARGALRLALAPPCRFVRTPDGRLQTRRYDDLDGAVVAIVTGTPLAGEAVPGLPPGCVGGSQGVLLRARTAAASARVARGIKCPAAGEDEKEFWLFAH